MYVCICQSVTDQQIRHAAASGVDNLYELREHLGVAAGCGSCADMAEEILREGRYHASPMLYVPTIA